MKNSLLIIGMLCISLSILSQPNCNTFKWAGDTTQYEACKLSEKFSDYYQFDMRGIAILDSCIEICPYYAFPYFEKAVVYLKSGNFLEWDHYINIAADLDPVNTLPYRASCRAKFFADYQGAIDDINQLDSIVDHNLGYTNGGMYHLNVWKGLCYKNLGDHEMAAKLISDHIKNFPDDIGFYDYLHLGVCYQKLGMHDKALGCFDLQKDINDIAENRYYATISFKALGQLDNYHKSLQTTKNYMNGAQKMMHPYRVLDDQIFQYDLDLLVGIKD